MNQKTIIIIVAVVLVLCLCGCVVGYLALRIGGQAVTENMVVSDPEEVGAAAGEIAEYDLPAGYKEEGVVNFLVGKMVMISPEGEGAAQTPVIMLMQLSVPVEGMDAEQMSKQMQESMERSLSQQDVQFEYVESQTLQINGQEVTLQIFEGATSDGDTIRQAYTNFFTGRSGTLMAMVIGTTTNWDQAEIEAFLQSIH